MAIGAEVLPGDILVGKVTPKGESPMTPEEKLLRAIFGEKASDVRDTSLRLPPGVAGTVVEVRVFNRHGVDKDERAVAIEREEIDRLGKDRDDEFAILNRNMTARLRELLVGKTAVSGPKGLGRGVISAEKLGEIAPGLWWQIALDDEKAMGELEAMRRQFDEATRPSGPPLRGQGRQAAPRRRAAPRRDEDGQGVRRGEAQAAARRQDGRPPRQQGGHLASILPIEDMPHLEDGTPGGHGAQSAGRALADERRPDLRNPPGLGLRGPGQADQGALLEAWQDGGQKKAELIDRLKEIYGADAELPETKRSSSNWPATWTRACRSPPRCSTARTSPTSKNMLEQAGLSANPARCILYDGQTGEQFKRPVTVGYIYMLKLHHLVDDKIHARSIGPYSLVTQQPLGGKAQFGGQRFGEMEVWALEAYGAAYTLQEMLTVKSDDVAGRTKVYESIVRGDDTFEAGIPESFNVLVKEMRSLGLNVELENG